MLDSNFSWLSTLGLLALLALAAGVGRWWLRGRGGSAIPALTPQAEETVNWHAQETETVLLRVNSSEGGLKQPEVERRLAEHGPNKLPEAKPRSPLMRFLAQFHNVLIYVLIVAGVVTALLQHWLDAGVIFGVVLINAIIGFVQEGKAEDALKAIRGMLSPHARVWRDGRLVTVEATELVPGDLVALQSGDKVPADLRLLRAKGIDIEEAALTGESVPVAKGTDPLNADTALADRRCMAYSGTLVTHGQGTGIVVATGAGTEIGRISAMVADVQQLTTPLLRQMAQFGRWLTLAILVIAAASFAFGLLVRDYSAADMFLASVGLAVAAIPEGLPAIMTITLAIGVQRMAGRNAIIRRLPAVETLGTVGVICSDKTGTLTRNEMTVGTVATQERRLSLSGTGYDPHGVFMAEDESIDAQDDPLLIEALRGVTLCNDASLEQREGGWRVHGGPMEGALMVAAVKGGLDTELITKELPRTDLIPFESSHKFMATLHHSHASESFIFVKGAPEAVLERCASERTRDGDRPLDLDAWQQRMEVMAEAGQRVLAVAVKPGEPHRGDLDFKDVEHGLTLLGLFGLMDPPREEAIAAVRVCQQAGIRVKMITGDHATTAKAIARQIGLCSTETALTGRELDAMEDVELQRRVSEVDVYARVTPEHKLRLVQRLQEAGIVVAMTGDGVNDAPALKRADVGVAMGINGTEAAKEASEMVLADDNFASIANAVEEGRTVYDNLRKAILFILPTNGGEALVVLGAILFGFQQFPLTPVQILWVNMITAVTLALALAFEPPEPGVMSRPPRDSRQPVLSPTFLWRIGYVSLILMVGTFSLFLLDHWLNGSIEQARTVAVNTLVMFEIFYLFNSRYMEAPVLNLRGLFGNRYVLLAVVLLILFQIAFTYWGPLQMLFGTAALGAGHWLLIVLVASSVLFIVEHEKRRVLQRRALESG
ncbi:cation-transporting P-type ATPase [Halochromatium salexigens]|uniref:Carbonate dehydratase n=1 Tax=Halochromatium salexigens TaxID=49447 RepID=A0AAJ0UF25_HALSE|nr:cation-transporting P-type ATPase [Halochromatium salexigens]MBK5930281.1 carbonate dehydratase [Halochromatium salexigens]